MSQDYFSKAVSGIDSVGTTFNLTKKTSVTLSHSTTQYFNSSICTIKFYLESISSASTLTFMLSEDSNGDKILIPDTSASIGTGLTTATSGNAVIQIDALLYSDVEEFYIFPKVDAGSCNITQITITYRVN